jgi:SNF2 family DNA or RNA helicase
VAANSPPHGQFIAPISQIKAEIELIKHVRITWPKGKIAIFSKFLKFLDLLDESIKRDSHLAAQKVVPLRFDGTTPFEQRPMIQEAFSSPSNDSPILVTPGPGGAGMNLQAATIAIISEP